MRTNLLLPKELVEEVDRYAGPRGHSRYVAEAIVVRLRRDRLREAVRRTAGAWRDHPIAAAADDATVLTCNVRALALTPVRVETY